MCLLIQVCNIHVYIMYLHMCVVCIYFDVYMLYMLLWADKKIRRYTLSYQPGFRGKEVIVGGRDKWKRKWEENFIKITCINYHVWTYVWHWEQTIHTSENKMWNFSVLRTLFPSLNFLKKDFSINIWKSSLSSLVSICYLLIWLLSAEKQKKKNDSEDWCINNGQGRHNLGFPKSIAHKDSHHNCD